MPTPYMSLAWPVPGVTAGPTYAADQVTAIALIDAHDHTAGKGALVPAAGFNIDSDLDFGGSDAAALRMARFDDQSGTLAASNLRGVYAVGGELYYNDGAGTAVQITSAGSVAGAAGNISGLASPAAVTWDSVNKIFAFTQTASFPAKIQCGDLIIYETTAGPSNAVTVKSPASLASAYAITLPAAVPATSALLFGTTGVALTFLAAPAATSLLQQTAAGALSWVDNRLPSVTALADAPATLAVWKEYVITPTVARILTLPTTGILAGERVRIINLAAAVKVTINASAGATKAEFQNGAMTLYALQNTPTTPAHWGILEAVGGASPCCGAYLSVSLSAQDYTSLTEIVLDAEAFDNNGDYDVANGRFTPTVPGKYRIDVQASLLLWTPASTGAAVEIRKNAGGTPYIYAYINTPDTVSGGGHGRASGVFDMNGIGDYLSMWVYVATDASVTLRGPGEQTYMYITRVGD